MGNGNRKIPKEAIIDLLNEGMGPTEIASKLGCSKGYVSQIKKKFRFELSKRTVIDQTDVAMKKHFAFMDELHKNYKQANDLLDFYKRCVEQDPQAIESLKKQTTLKRIKFSDPGDLALKAIAETRKILNLYVDTAAKVYDFENIKKFQQIVLNVIGDIEPDARNRIIKELEHINALGGSVNFLEA